ncbi:ELL-associated factor 2 [Cucumis sativus]|uniref:Transcription elongation factor Eaf N-terminal domain-containing protein n=1 Tax=Cucumis sativus TaxID=3659 RepID=A0A0A0KM56_CUCSA|nr:ELL-associated factor 2 [Cucumis sativus]KGN50678.1 hypothetical protein Csa_005786 [Cucumis sativus]
MANNIPEEPKTAPQPDRWYNLSLGPSFKDESSNKFCTFRYEFKPASIDKTKPGWLKKTKENRVTVEFQNSQPGKPNLSFVGSSEDYKENDAVLFFDGETFRLERLHRAVNQLRHLRQPGESAAAVAAPATTAGVAAPAAAPTTASVLHSLTPPEPRLSPPVTKVSKPMHMGRSSFPTMPVEVERIDIGEPGNAGAKTVASKGLTNYSSDPPNVSVSSPGLKNDDEHQDIDIDDIFGSVSSDDGNNAEEERVEPGFDINIPHQNDTDDEIADVDDSGDEAEKGPNAAEALRAQVNAEGRAEQSSSSSSSGSGSGSSSGSSSASSDSEASDEDSVTSI